MDAHPGAGTGGSTGVAVHSGPAAGGGAQAARPGCTGALTSVWSGRGRSLQVRFFVCLDDGELVFITGNVNEFFIVILNAIA